MCDIGHNDMFVTWEKFKSKLRLNKSLGPSDYFSLACGHGEVKLYICFHLRP